MYRSSNFEAETLFPSEVDTSLLELGEKKYHSDTDWSAFLTYDGEQLHLQTPLLKNVFGISEYKNSNTKINYSVSFELDEGTKEVKDFKSFLVSLDKWFIEQFRAAGITGNYYSSLRPSKKDIYPDTFRLKLKTRRDVFDCRYQENSVGKPFTIKNTDYIQHGDYCRAIIELMPVWSANGRCGITWKVATLMKKVKPVFRKKVMGLAMPSPTRMVRQQAIPGGKDERVDISIMSPQRRTSPVKSPTSP